MVWARMAWVGDGMGWEMREMRALRDERDERTDESLRVHGEIE